MNADDYIVAQHGMFWAFRGCTGTTTENQLRGCFIKDFEARLLYTNGACLDTLRRLNKSIVQLVD